ncbi:hypothetical protein TNIN_398731 [Trichonephila inaurata madagascariensis]|uniref:Uncharacterized protein n=1 Tax=Trichonephila inaurata madagascariensis TaxID=2747483 RepID=A0A8X6MHZ9_9ARAC|nr:hypothetical protein TNIN_398731 [Trichonephila inaurata madagascariensis]
MCCKYEIYDRSDAFRACSAFDVVALIIEIALTMEGLLECLKKCLPQKKELPSFPGYWVVKHMKRCVRCQPENNHQQGPISGYL